MVAITIVLVALAGITGRAAAERRGRRTLEYASMRVRSELTMLLGQAERLSASTASLLTDHLFPVDDPSVRGRLLAAELEAFPAVSVWVFARPDGSAVGAIHDPDGLVLLLVRDGVAVERRIGATGAARREGSRAGRTEAEAGASRPAEGPAEVDDAPIRSYPFDPRERPWYRAGIDATSPRWIEPYSFVRRGVPGFDLGTSHVRAVRDADGALLGVLSVDVTFDTLDRFLRETAFAAGGELLVADPTLLVAASAGPATDERGERRRIAPALDAILRRGLPADEIVAAVELDGEPHLAAFSPLPLGNGQTWIVVATLAERAVLREARRSELWMIGLSAVALASAVGGLLWLGRRVSTPVQSLQRHVRRLSEGDFSARLDLRAARELEALSADLNHMGAALKERMALQQSMHLARQVQQAMLPDRTFTRPGIELLCHIDYADSAGGDSFDYLEIPGKDAVLVAVGDVMGHGVASALLMATARASLRSEARRTESLGAMLLRVSSVLLQSRGHGRFMTMFLLMLEPGRRRIRWANAGHEAGLLVPPEGDVRTLAGGDMPLGIDAGVVYFEYSLDDVPPGSLVFIGTDGIKETAAPSGELFGDHRLVQVLHANASQPLTGVRDALVGAVRAFRGDEPVRDDLTFVLARVTGDGLKSTSH
ncbi:MAG: SpoIIE family protein phosphatase [Phycisphaerales bacterium]